jgi:hypothetical protein
MRPDSRHEPDLPVIGLATPTMDATELLGDDHGVARGSCRDQIAWQFANEMAAFKQGPATSPFRH